MKNKNEAFRKLHSKESFFVLGNAWDLISARAFQEAGYSAIGTSSWALSQLHGRSDGEVIPFSIVLENAKSIVDSIAVPLSIDIESGYSSDVNEIVSNVLDLARIGCSGINIEDSNKKSKQLNDVFYFSNLISEIKKSLIREGFEDFVINARTDTFLLLGDEDKIDQTIKRGKAYFSSGADCLFVPGMFDLGDINIVAKEVELPINVMCLPGMSNANALKVNGVNRLSLGNAAFDSMLSFLESKVALIKKSGDYQSLYEHDDLKTMF